MKIIQGKAPPSWKAGIPVVLAIVTSAYFMKYFLQVQIDSRESKQVWSKVKNFKPTCIEDEVKDLENRMDIENWQNKRIPRPEGWEHTTNESK